MSNRVLISLLALFVVLFFGYQWWSVAKKTVTPVAQTRPVAEPLTGGDLAASRAMEVVPQPLPELPGRTEQDLKRKEPVQERRIGGQAQPVTDEGHGPAQFEDNLRHPENLFHQPQQSEITSDQASGRAAAQSAPLTVHQQPFSPEFAQNGGALIGDSMFAYDGMEPTTFSSF
jgi:hypothetical protein